MGKKNLLSKISLGTASFGNVYGVINRNKLSSFSEIGRILETFYSHGGYIIDTSSGYGTSEEIIGNLLKDNNNGFQINTKFVLDSDNGIESIKRQVDNSYRIFGNKINSILCHTPDIFLSDKRDLVYSAFEYIKDNICINVGLSIYSVDEINNLDIKFKESISDIQAPLNIFDLTALKLKEKKLINWNYKVHARSIFLQGLLISEETIYKRFEKQLILFNEYCQKYKLTKKEVCIRFAMQNNDIDSLVVGINCLEHLNNLISIIEKIQSNENMVIKNLQDQNCDKYFTDPRKWHLIKD